MSYYPILSAPYCVGETILYNFPPNHWELTKKNKQYINLTYAEDNLWHSMVLDELDYQAYKKFSNKDVIDLTPEGVLPLLSLSHTQLPKINKQLPVFDCNRTTMPAYRSTLRLKSDFTTTSY